MHAGIELYRSELRYAEVEQQDEQYRLLRLGSCEFDFDVGRALLGGGEAEHLDTMAEALRDVFSGAQADTVSVALHPSDSLTFVSALPVGMAPEEREARLRREAGLLAGDGGAAAYFVTAAALRTETLDDGRQVEWFHTLAVDAGVRERLDRVMRQIPRARYRLAGTAQGAAAVVARLEAHRRRTAGENPRNSLVLGCYDGHFEYALLNGGRWHFSHSAATASLHDALYFVVALMARLDVRPPAVDRLYLYGDRTEAVDPALLAELFTPAPEALNPIQVVSLEMDHLSSGFHSEAYVPCIGVAL